MWMKIKNNFERASYSSRIFLKRKLYSTRLENNQMDKFISTITGIADKLRLAGEDIKGKEIISMLFCGLPECYDGIILAFEARDDDSITLDQVKNKLMDEASRKTERSAQEEQAFLSYKSSSKYGPNKQERVCYECRRPNHIKYNCPRLSRNNDGKREERYYRSDSDARKVTENNFFTSTKDRNNSTSTSHDAEESEPFHSYILLSLEDQQSAISQHTWILDSGATAHMCKEMDKIECYYKFQNPKMITLGDGTRIPALGRGNLMLTSKGENSDNHLLLEGVMFVPELKLNLVSIPKLVVQGYKVVFNEKGCLLYYNKDLIITGSRKKGMFEIVSYEPGATVLSACVHTWHKRLGHRDVNTIKSMASNNIVKNLKIDQCNHEDNCHTCKMGGSKQKPFHNVSHKQSSRPFFLIHSDVCGPIHPTSRGGGRYYLTLIDDYSRFCYLAVIGLKSEVIQVVKNYINHFSNKFGYLPAYFRSDGGGEFNNNDLNDFLTSRGINHQFSVPYCPEQNGVSEKLNQTLNKMMKCLLIEKGLDSTLWGEAVNTACHLYNRTMHSYTQKTPYELWEMEVPDVGYLKIMGSLVFSHVPTQLRGKLDNNSDKGILLGYSNKHKAYKVLNSSNGKIKVTRNADFDEHDESSVNTHENCITEEELQLILPETPTFNDEINYHQPDKDVLRRSTRSTFGIRPLRYISE